MNILWFPLCVFGFHQIHISVLFPRYLFTLGFSYSFPRLVNTRLVGSSGVEPPTSCLSGMRSNLLSYEPLLLAQPRSTFDLQSNSYEPRFRFCNRWWRWRESNPWPPACRAGALPAELHPHIGYSFFPTVPGNRTTTECANRVYVVCLFLCELRKIIFQSLLFSIERRWSSRTFRYGYLVTT